MSKLQATAIAIEDPRDAAEERSERLRKAIATKCRREAITQARIAQEAGIDTTALVTWMNGQKRVARARVERLLEVWLDDNPIKPAEPAPRIPGVPEFVLTTSAQRIWDAITFADQMRDLVIIFRKPGIGKTEAIKAYAAKRSNTHVLEFQAAHTTKRAVLEALADALGLPSQSRAERIMNAAALELANADAVLVCDEAQYLEAQGLEVLRGIHDKSRCGLVLAGNTYTFANSMQGKRAEFLTPLQDRVGLLLRLEETLGDDVDAIIGAMGVTDPTVRALCHELATKPRGSLRALVKALRAAPLYGDGQNIKPQDLKRAWRHAGRPL